MKLSNILVIAMLIALLTSCVSSSVQKVGLNLPQELRHISVREFNYPEWSHSSKVSTDTHIDGLNITMTHTYKFTDSDKAIIRQSLLGSLELSRVKVVESELSDTYLNIDIIDVGMLNVGYGETILLITAEVEIIHNGSSLTRIIEVDDGIAGSIAASKNDSIRIFIKRIADVINSIQYNES